MPEKQKHNDRQLLVQQMKDVVLSSLIIEEVEASSMTLLYQDFYLNISFAPKHPLMVMQFARAINRTATQKDRKLLNEMNLHGILGSFAWDEKVDCYSYRTAHWLDCLLTKNRFLEILERCYNEAERGYKKIVTLI